MYMYQKLLWSINVLYEISYLDNNTFHYKTRDFFILVSVSLFAQYYSYYKNVHKGIFMYLVFL